jgi:SAM-dependent methyltransferase
MLEEPVTTEQAQGQSGSGGARDWSTFQESHFRPFYDAVHDRIEIGNRTQLLDVGCGPGGAAVLAAARGARVAGLDISAAAINVAAERIQEGDFRVGDMESLPWPDASFDVVTGFNSFQFASNRVAALAEAHRVLRQDGKLGIVVWAPPEQSQQPRIMAAISALAPPSPADAPGPFALSKPGVLESALNSASFQPVDSGEIPILVEYPDGETACRAMMAGSGGARAVQHSGEERVRQTILEALQAYRSQTGGYRLQNRFRFVIAE